MDAFLQELFPERGEPELIQTPQQSGGYFSDGHQTCMYLKRMKGGNPNFGSQEDLSRILEYSHRIPTDCRDKKILFWGNTIGKEVPYIYFDKEDGRWRSSVMEKSGPRINDTYWTLIFKEPE